MKKLNDKKQVVAQISAAARLYKKNLVGKHKHHFMLLWQQVLNKLSVIEIKMKILVVSLFLMKHSIIWMNKEFKK